MLGGANTVLEYSINGSDYKEFEVTGTYWGTPVIYNCSSNTDSYIVPEGETEIIVKNKATGDIYLKGLLVNKGDYVLIIEKRAVGNYAGTSIRLNDEVDENWQYYFKYQPDEIKYSINNSEEKYSVMEGTGGNNDPMLKGLLEEDDITVENLVTNEIIYQSPKIGQIAENIKYENGKSIITFETDGTGKDKTKYAYNMIENETEGNTIEIEEDSKIKLMANMKKEFASRYTEKEIDVKVVKIDSPTIKKEDDETFSISAGEIVNDEFGSIYYSIDDEEYKEYKDLVNLSPGKHMVKAYQVSNLKNVKSNEIQMEIDVPQKEENEKEEDEKKNETEKSENELIIEENDNNDEMDSEKNDIDEAKGESNIDNRGKYESCKTKQREFTKNR